MKRRLADSTLHEEMDGLSYLKQEGIEPVVVDSSPAWLNPLAKHGSLWSGIDPVRFVRLLAGYWKYDLILSIDSSSACLFVLWKRLLGLKKPVMVVDPALDANYARRTKLHGMVLPFVQEVIVFGEVQMEFLRKAYGTRVRARFLKHRMDTEFYDSSLTAPAAPETPMVVSVGDDIGRDYECMARAAVGVPALVLLHTRRAITSPLPENVRVQKMWITDQELRQLYASASIVAVPLHKTVHPSGINALLEAMSMGKAVVVSASPGVIDYVEHGKTAWVVEPDDVEGMRAGLITLLLDPELRERLGRNARQFCEANCAMPIYARQVAASIRRCVAGKA